MASSTPKLGRPPLCVSEDIKVTVWSCSFFCLVSHLRLFESLSLENPDDVMTCPGLSVFF